MLFSVNGQRGWKNHTDNDSKNDSDIRFVSFFSNCIYSNLQKKIEKKVKSLKKKSKEKGAWIQKIK